MQKLQTNSNKVNFTLIEIILATAMFAIIMASLMSVLYTVHHLQKTIKNTLAKHQPNYQLQQIITDDLNYTLPPSGILTGSFIGKKEETATIHLDSLEFFANNATITQENPWSDIQKIEYYLDTENSTATDGFTLIRTVTNNLLATQEEEPPQTTLIKNVASLQINYYKQAEDLWEESWNSSLLDGKLPAAVKFYIEFIPTDSNPHPTPLQFIIPLTMSDATNTEGE